MKPLLHNLGNLVMVAVVVVSLSRKTDTGNREQTQVSSSGKEKKNIPQKQPVHPIKHKRDKIKQFSFKQKKKNNLNRISTATTT